MSLSAAAASLEICDSIKFGDDCTDGVIGPGLEQALGGWDCTSKGEYDLEDLE